MDATEIRDAETRHRAFMARGALAHARKWFTVNGWKELPRGIRGQRILEWGADQAWLAAESDRKRERSVRNWCRRWKPKITKPELDAIVAHTVESNKRWSQDQSATVLGISVRDRTMHGLHFLGADDDPNWDVRNGIKAAKHAARSRKFRAAHSTGRPRGRPKSVVPKPWEMLGQTRRTYYRHRGSKSLISNDMSGTTNA